MSSDSPPALPERIVALLEVLLCSGFPTQLALGATLIWAGVQPLRPDGTLNLTYVSAVSLIDAVVLTALITVCLRAHGESLRGIILGDRPIRPELALGAKLIVLAFVVAVVVLGVILQFAPQLHT